MVDEAITYSGDDAGFTEFFLATYPGIVRHLNFLIGDTEEAHQLAQEAFIRTYVRWKRASAMQFPAAWVRKLALRLSFRWMARHMRAEQAVDAIREGSHLDTDRGLIIDVRRAVASLPSRQRAAIILRYFDDLPLSEIAMTMRCSENTAKAHLGAARKQLAKCLSDYGPEKS